MSVARRRRAAARLRERLGVAVLYAGEANGYTLGSATGQAFRRYAESVSQNRVLNKHNGGGTMKSTKTVLIAIGLMLVCGLAWSQTAAPAPAPARGARLPQANWWS